MQHLGVAASVLSLARPGFPFGGAARAAELARVVNEYGADLVREQPARFGIFASVPLPGLDAALREVEYAFDHLSCDGVVLLSNYDGLYLGDPALDELMAELDRREAVLFVHPATPPGPALAGVPVFAADFLLETTRVALNMVRNGVLKRYPRLKIMLAHGGGFLPYASHRIAGLTPMGEDGTLDRDAFLRECGVFYFDTALTASPFSMPSLLAFAAEGHILFGSDWPFAGRDNAEHFTAELDAYPLSAAARGSIERGAALRLFPRFARLGERV
jgi:predicted TIM-barrel fold metal-dependent hydrolase